MLLTSPGIRQASFRSKVHKVPRDSGLDAHVTKLAPNAEEKRVLFPKRAGIFGAVLDLGFEGFLIRVCDFGERGKEEEDDEEDNETCYSEVGPLDVF